jgi:hypothetical protein
MMRSVCNSPSTLAHRIGTIRSNHAERTRQEATTREAALDHDPIKLKRIRI